MTTTSSPSSNPGIVSMACYFPKLYVSQDELEEFNGVSKGKYTLGLGQQQMAFVSDREDIASISLTVLSRLMDQNPDITYHDIGYVCVATETIIDHSKSVSSMLMQLFEEHGNHSVEGIDVKHACYAGTFALFSAFDRVSSKYWDGKYCVVIAADIAEYAEGPARCTGGCGAVALLIGKNGCIELEETRASFKANEYDFYKPNLDSPHPVVNGHVSNACYINALDSCYSAYCDKTNEKGLLVDRMDYFLFHSPYNKLVRKSFGRVMYNDYLRQQKKFSEKYADPSDEKLCAILDKYANVPCKETRNERELIKTFEKLSKNVYKEKVEATTGIPRTIGNCYTASIFMGLMSLVTSSRDDIQGKLAGKRIAAFSYGSGTLASLYGLKIGSSMKAVKQLKAICDNNDIDAMLRQRTKIDCAMYSQIMAGKEAHGDRVTQPSADVDLYVSENAFYLNEISDTKQRSYAKRVASAVVIESETASETRIHVVEEARDGYVDEVDDRAEVKEAALGVTSVVKNVTEKVSSLTNLFAGFYS